MTGKPSTPIARPAPRLLSRRGLIKGGLGAVGTAGLMGPATSA